MNINHLKRLIASRTETASPDFALESATAHSAEIPTPETDAVRERVENSLRNRPEDEIGDAGEYARAYTIFREQLDRTLRKWEAAPEAPLDQTDGIVLEAVIRTDGTRPSFLLRNGEVRSDHPQARPWSAALSAIQATLPSRAAAVGRVQPKLGSATRFFGTGWVVDDRKGLVLTNLHVLHAMLKSIPNGLVQTASGFRVLKGAAFVDFAGEANSLEKRLFQIVEAIPSGVDGPGFERLDTAILRIETVSGEGATANIPAAIPVIADLSAPSGASGSFCIIGFPGRPEITTGVVDGVNWDWVTRTLFGNRFGVKRLAPGEAHKPLGEIQGDSKKWIFGHDATTLGGSSGSPVLAWGDDGFGGFGLHFAGSTLDKNFGHALARCRKQLERIGVPVQEALEE